MQKERCWVLGLQAKERLRLTLNNQKSNVSMVTQPCPHSQAG